MSTKQGLVLWVGTVPSRDGIGVRTVELRHSNLKDFVFVVERFAKLLSKKAPIDDFPLEGITGISAVTLVEKMPAYGYKEVFDISGSKILVEVPKESVTVVHKNDLDVFSGKIVFDFFKGEGDNPFVPECL